MQERLKFTDVIKEQEKTLTKLKLEQEINETLAEEAIYEAEVNEESIIQPIPYLPQDSLTSLHRFLNREQFANTSVPQPANDKTFEIGNPPTTTPVTSHVETLTTEVVTHNVTVTSSFFVQQ